MIADTTSRAALGLAALGLLLLGPTNCRGEYTLEPTACDDWCLAVQRADCRDDRPDDCVRDCESEALGRTRPECQAEWLELADCYRRADTARFSCVEDESRPDDDLCVQQRVALGECVSARQGACTEDCIHGRSSCGESTWRCEPDCLGEPPGCDEEYVAFYRCRSQQPVDCNPEESDTDEEDAPCYAEALEVLDCAGWEE